MEKKADFQLGITKCSYCNNIATIYINDVLYCDECAKKVKYKTVPEEK